jgi:predicted NACHT family NTPase
MKKKIALIAGASALVAGLVLLVSAWMGPSSAEAKKDFCNSLNNLSATVMSYQGLDPATATNDELDSAADDIKGAYDRVVNDAEDWANAYDNPLNEAYNNLYWEIQSLPSDNTAAEDLNAVDDELAAFPQAFNETFDGSGCSTSS